MFMFLSFRVDFCVFILQMTSVSFMAEMFTAGGLVALF